ncbi:tudor domain-containing protein 7-like [Haemaphysalis longicornis]
MDATAPNLGGVGALPSNNTGSSNDSTSPQQGEWWREYVDVIVSCVTATDNVCTRFAVYDAQYKELLREMAAHYNSEAKPTERPETGELYATLHDGRWLRVRTVGECGGWQVLCEFVDEGQTLFIAPQALMELKSCFAELPTQAIQWQLCGLLGYSRYTASAEVLSDVLLGKTLVAQIISRRDPASVVLFDVSGPQHVNLNEVVLERLMTACFPPEGHRGHCHLTHVGKDGLLTVQMKGTSLSILHDLMCFVNKRCQYAPRSTMIHEVPAMGTLYACEFPGDGSFRRAVLTSPDPLPSGQFQVRYVDFGDQGTAFMAEFRTLDSFRETLSRLPYQALQCRLDRLTEQNGVSWPEEASSLLHDIIGRNPELLLKVTRPAEGENVALIELFRREDSGPELLSVNRVLVHSLKYFAPESFAATGKGGA